MLGLVRDLEMLVEPYGPTRHFLLIRALRYGADLLIPTIRQACERVNYRDICGVGA